MVRLHQPIRVRDPCGFGRVGVVDDVAPERREFEIADHFGGGGSGLRELAGDPADLHDRDADGVGEHDGHLEDDAQLLSDVVGGELLEALRAVAGLEEERVACGDPGEFGLQRSGLAGEHERRHRGDLFQRLLERCGIGPVGLLAHGVVVPGRRRPGGSALGHPIRLPPAKTKKRPRFPGAVRSSGRWVWGLTPAVTVRPPGCARRRRGGRQLLG